MVHLGLHLVPATFTCYVGGLSSAANTATSANAANIATSANAANDANVQIERLAINIILLQQQSSRLIVIALMKSHGTKGIKIVLSHGLAYLAVVVAIVVVVLLAEQSVRLLWSML